MNARSRVGRVLACALGASTIGLFAMVATSAPAFAGSVPSGTQGLTGVSCPSASMCVAVGTSGAIVTANGGSSWSSSPLTAANWEGVSCSSTSDCVAAGADTGFTNGLIDATANGGTSWQQVLTTPGEYLAVSCVPNGCLAVGQTSGGAGLVAATAGGSWSTLTAPAGSTRLSAVSCVDALHCWAGGSASGTGRVYATSDGGQTWSTETLAPNAGQPVQQDFPVSLDFIDAAHGFATLGSGGCGGPGVIGCGGEIEATTDGGATWTLQETIGNGPGEHAISCVDVMHCMVVGGDKNGGVIQTTSDGGAHWAQQGGTSASFFYGGVSCPTGGACVVVGAASNANTPPAAAGSTAGVGGTPPPPPSCVARGFSPAPTGIVSRLAGANRDQTAIAVSKAGFSAAGSAKAVVLASDFNYPDALAGTPLAVAKTAPLLLTPPAGLTAEVSAEISRVAPKGSTVYILGGTSAVSGAADTQVQGLGDKAQRISGANRFATAVAIAGALGDPKTILEATGVNFPDALSGGAAAAVATGAVLLTNGSTQAAETSSYLSAHSGDTRTAVGGPAAAADPGATPVVGADRYATAVDVAQKFFKNPTQLGFASGVNFPDALSGGANVGAAGGPMLVVPPCGSLAASTSGYLTTVKHSVTAGSLYGGPGAVGDDILAQLESAA